MRLKIIEIRPSEFNLVFRPGDNILFQITIMNVGTKVGSVLKSKSGI